MPYVCGPLEQQSDCHMVGSDLMLVVSFDAIVASFDAIDNAVRCER